MMTQELREAIEKVIEGRWQHGASWDDHLAESIDALEAAYDAEVKP